MKKLSLSLLLLVLTISVSAFATGKYKHKMHKWWENDEITKEVGLSGKQISEINAISMSYSDQFEKLRSEWKALHKEFMDLMSDPKSTNEKITAKHNELIAKKTEKKQLKLEKKLKIRAVLTNDQIVKLAEIKKEMWGKYREGKECSYKDGKECSYKKDKEGCRYKDKT
jgi:Spy/CpxP family protein refolding chaperone